MEIYREYDKLGTKSKFLGYLKCNALDTADVRFTLDEEGNHQLAMDQVDEEIEYHTIYFPARKHCQLLSNFTDELVSYVAAKEAMLEPDYRPYTIWGESNPEYVHKKWHWKQNTFNFCLRDYKWNLQTFI